MTRLFLTFILPAMLAVTSCNKAARQENAEASKTEAKDTTNDNIVHWSLTSTEGNTLDMVFDNAKDEVTIHFMGETATLVSQIPASGIWYKNDHYELTGKGFDIELKWDGKTIFEHHDDIVAVRARNDKGDVLDMTFNNTRGTVKVYLNGGEQIDLVEQKPDSGIWYKNDHYGLSGKGDKYELLKDGKTVFKN